MRNTADPYDMTTELSPINTANAWHLPLTKDSNPAEHLNFFHECYFLFCSFTVFKGYLLIG